MSKLTITVDDKTIVAEDAKTVLQVALENNVAIPHFCYHKKLSLAATCRMCMTEINGRLLPACVTPVSSNMVVSTKSETVKKAQKAVLEFLLINHPLDCPICDQAGECHLQNTAFSYGQTHARFTEEKRVSWHLDSGPLIAMEEMNRCIFCTRCIRFTKEVAGVQEVGILNRSPDVTLAIKGVLKSELSGNLIDLCPVGAITSRPFRFKARSWELQHYPSISPHDSLGTNILVHTKNHRVMRITPRENEAINECWITNHDRFGYLGLDKERLTDPMVKQNNEWIKTSWTAALDYIVRGLKEIKEEGQIEGIASSQATLEEMALLQKIVENATCFSAYENTPSLNCAISDLEKRQNVFVIGSFIRDEAALIATRLRKGPRVSRLHAIDEDWMMPIATQIISAPSLWPQKLAEVLVASLKEKGKIIPEPLAKITPTKEAKDIALSLSKESTILLGDIAHNHLEAKTLQTLANEIAQVTGASCGQITYGANSVGAAYLGFQEAFKNDAKAYLLLHSEPEKDASNIPYTLQKLNQAKMVVVLSAYEHGHDYADVMLPIAPFSETSGSYMNVNQTVQSFEATTLGARPAWKVLNVLGELLHEEKLFESSQAVLESVKQTEKRLSKEDATYHLTTTNGIERLAKPIRYRDAILRRAFKDENNEAFVSLNIAKEKGIQDGQMLEISSGENQITLVAKLDETLADNVIMMASEKAALLGALYGHVEVKRVC